MLVSAEVPVIVVRLVLVVLSVPAAVLLLVPSSVVIIRLEVRLLLHLGLELRRLLALHLRERLLRHLVKRSSMRLLGEIVTLRYVGLALILATHWHRLAVVARSKITRCRLEV